MTRKYTLALAAFLIGSIAAAGPLMAQKAKDVALLFKSKGTVEIKTPADPNWTAGRRGKRLNAGDDLRTGQNSLAALVFTDDKSLMRVWKNSSLTIEGERDKNTIKKRVKMEFGQFFVNMKKQRTSFIVETPSGVAAVRGTSAYFRFENNRFIIDTITNLVDAANTMAELIQGRVVPVPAGFTGIVSGGQIQVVPTQNAPNFGQAEGTDEYIMVFETATGAQIRLVITVGNQEQQ